MRSKFNRDASEEEEEDENQWVGTGRRIAFVCGYVKNLPRIEDVDDAASLRAQSRTRFALPQLLQRTLPITLAPGPW